jgi:hypothetical protein
VDASGNLYIGGNFNVAGNVMANHIAKWDGTNWSRLGDGLAGFVYALAVSPGSGVDFGTFSPKWPKLVVCDEILCSGRSFSISVRSVLKRFQLVDAV